MYTHMNFTGKGFIGQTEVKVSDDRKKGTIRLAATDTWKDNDGNRQERTHWFTVTVFMPSLIELIEKGWLAKGRYVEVTGELRDARWTDKKGVEHFETQLLGQSIQFLDRKPEGDA